MAAALPPPDFTLSARRRVRHWVDGLDIGSELFVPGRYFATDGRHFGHFPCPEHLLDRHLPQAPSPPQHIIADIRRSAARPLPPPPQFHCPQNLRRTQRT
jgi:hypothetical protein